MDDDLQSMSQERLIEEVRRLRNGIRTHRDSAGHELCWHHPAMWGLLPEKTDPLPTVPEWPVFMRGCIRYRESLDTQLPRAPRSDAPFGLAPSIQATTQGLERERLQVFVGTWRTEGDIVGSTDRLEAVDTYEWFPGEYFLVHRVEGRVGAEEVRALELIGVNATAGTYFTRAFDNHGLASQFAMRVRDEHTWSIIGTTERFTGCFNAAGDQLTGTWEQRDERGEWKTWMTVRLAKQVG
jgi:hypothetical protein